MLIPELFHLGSDGAHGETWAGLMDALELAVADDLSIGEVGLQGDE